MDGDTRGGSAASLVCSLDSPGRAELASYTVCQDGRRFAPSRRAAAWVQAALITNSKLCLLSPSTKTQLATTPALGSVQPAVLFLFGVIRPWCDC